MLERNPILASVLADWSLENAAGRAERFEVFACSCCGCENRASVRVEERMVIRRQVQRLR